VTASIGRIGWWVIMAGVALPLQVLAQTSDQRTWEERYERYEQIPKLMRVTVNADDTARRIQQVRQSIPVSPGPLTLHYPQWIPGHHAATGGINQMAGLAFAAQGKPLTWRRDPKDMYAFQLEIPEGVNTLSVQFDYLSPTATDQGRVAMTPNLLAIQWHRVVLYPKGADTREVQIAATLCVPAGWQAASGLRGVRRDNCEVYEPVSVMTLIDSPVYAGRHLARFPLDAGKQQPVVLHVTAEQPSLLEADPAVLAAHKALVAETDVLFGQRPFAHYDFLLALSNTFSGIGLEHAQSSENGMHEGYLQGEPPIADNDLLAHEYVHAWIGKAWRPEGSFSPHYNAPADNRGLWIYEGLTQYWALVLSARSGLWNREQALARLAQLQAQFAGQSGRRWRDLADTQYQGIVDFNDKPQAWADWQRGFDFYDESILLWLEVDARLRTLSAGKRDLDGFSSMFFRGGQDGSIRTFHPDAVVLKLEEYQPGSWGPWFDARLHDPEGKAPEGVAAAGWEVVWSDKPNAMVRDDEASGSTDLQHSLGLKLASDGRIRWVGWNSPAFAVGLARDVQVVAVNGLAFSGARLKAAVRGAAEGAALELLVRQADSFRTVRIDYRGGLRYPQLQRARQGRDHLDAILAPRR
jgi:predicted metalloprotease with PDZ domain